MYVTIEEDAGLGSSTNSRVTADAADADVHTVSMSPFYVGFPVTGARVSA